MYEGQPRSIRPLVAVVLTLVFALGGWGVAGRHPIGTLFGRAPSSTIDFPVPKGTSIVARGESSAFGASVVYAVPLPIDQLSAYYNQSITRGTLKSDGWSIFVNGWSGPGDPVPAAGATQWPLVRLTDVGDGSLDSLDVSLSQVADGSTRVTVNAGLHTALTNGNLTIRERTSAR